MEGKVYAPEKAVVKLSGFEEYANIVIIEPSALYLVQNVVMASKIKLSFTLFTFDLLFTCYLIQLERL